MHVLEYVGSFLCLHQNIPCQLHCEYTEIFTVLFGDSSRSFLEAVLSTRSCLVSDGWLYYQRLIVKHNLWRKWRTSNSPPHDVLCDCFWLNNLKKNLQSIRLFHKWICHHWPRTLHHQSAPSSKLWPFYLHSVAFWSRSVAKIFLSNHWLEHNLLFQMHCT